MWCWREECLDGYGWKTELKEGDDVCVASSIFEHVDDPEALPVSWMYVYLTYFR